eukprot:4186306-Pyramimonas_sp.AAC.1
MVPRGTIQLNSSLPARLGPTPHDLHGVSPRRRGGLCAQTSGPLGQPPRPRQHRLWQALARL